MRFATTSTQAGNGLGCLGHFCVIDRAFYNQLRTFCNTLEAAGVPSRSEGGGGSVQRRTVPINSDGQAENHVPWQNIKNCSKMRSHLIDTHEALPIIGTVRL